ncbi:unnamed protein product [Paramecium pentaurelia]|uniref:Uncharacterized protein n=1 Tax=Paramecium pentaurelia TaxID=43138 RepID=A0A8S1YN90_9CILI|nr:unnamed protein product [Paramecium pentaurelia]
MIYPKNKPQWQATIIQKYGLDLAEQINSQENIYLNKNYNFNCIQNLEQEINGQKALPQLQQQQSSNQLKQKDEDDQNHLFLKFQELHQYPNKTEKNREEKKNKKMTGVTYQEN